MRVILAILCVVATPILGHSAYQQFSNGIRAVVEVDAISVSLPGESLNQAVVFPSDNPFSGGLPYRFYYDPIALGEMRQDALCRPQDRHRGNPHFVFYCAWEQDGQWHRRNAFFALPDSGDVKYWHFDRNKSILVPAHKSWGEVNNLVMLEGLLYMIMAVATTFVAYVAGVLLRPERRVS